METTTAVSAAPGFRSDADGRQPGSSTMRPLAREIIDRVDGNTASRRPTNEILRNCPICDHDNSDRPRSSFSQTDWDLKTCSNCQLLYLQNVLAYEELEENYAWTKTSEHEAQQRTRRRGITGWFRHEFKQARMKWLPHPKAKTLTQQFVGRGKVLDIGCGSGGWLSQLGEGLIPYGIEIDRKAAAIANAFATQRGGQVYQMDALSGLQSIEADQFDGVLMQSYLEHEIKPLEVLRETQRVLRPGGVAIIKVPNFACWNRYLQGSAWPGFRFPDHVNYFTPDSIRQIVTRADLHVARFSLLDHTPTSDNLWIVAEKAA